MKKRFLLILSSMFCIQLVGCTNQKEINKQIVTWRIAAYANDAELADELINIWEVPLNELLKEKNAPYQVNIIPFSNTGEDLQMSDLKALKKAGEQTDVITLLPGDAQNTYVSAIENDLLSDLKEWKNNNKEALSMSLTSYDFQLSSIKNHLYGISSNVPYLEGTAYNKELLNQYGINAKEINENLFENTELFIKVREQTKTIPISYLPLNTASLGLWSDSTINNLTWEKEEGFISLSKTKKYRELLQSCEILKQQGLFQQAPAAIVNKSALIASMDKPNARRDIFEVEKQGATMSKDGTYVIVPNKSLPYMNLYYGDHKSGIASWSENKENAEDFLLKLFTDKDIANLIQYGIEGENYQLDDQQHITITNAGIGLTYAAYQYTNPKITYSSSYEEDDKVAYANWFYSTFGDHFPAGFRFDQTPVEDEILVTNKLINNDLVNKVGDGGWNDQIIEMNFNDVDSFLDAVNAELDANGMQTIVDEANRQYREWQKEIE